MLDVQLIQPTPRYISLKIFEDVITHDFKITDNGVDYLITKRNGVPVAKSTAEVTGKNDDDGQLRGVTIRTDTYDFEIVQDENYNFRVYRSLRLKS